MVMHMTTNQEKAPAVEAEEEAKTFVGKNMYRFIAEAWNRPS